MKKKYETFDYQSICTKDTPKLERRKKDIGDIWSNSAQCLKCGEILRSKNRHDYVTCKCGNLSVDGGSWYCKRSYEDQSTVKEMNETFSDYEVGCNEY